MVSKKSKVSKKFYRRLWAALFVLFLFASVFATTAFVKYYRNFISRASIGRSEVFTSPDTLTLLYGQNQSTKLFVTSDQNVAFVDVTINFDNALLQLSASPTLTNPLLSRVIRSTDLTTANSHGKLTLTLGLDPAHKNNPPTGTFELASLSFQPKSSTTGETKLSFPENSLQIVATSAQVTSVTSKSTTIALNPTPSPSPTPTPTTPSSHTPAPTPKLSPLPSPSPKTIFQSSPPTPTPLPTATLSCHPCSNNTCNGRCEIGKDRWSCPDCRMFNHRHYWSERWQNWRKHFRNYYHRWNHSKGNDNETD